MKHSASQSWFDRSFLIFAAIISIASVSFLFSNIRITPELTDASYYILNVTTPFEIDNQLSLFGPVWYAFAGPLDIVSSRALHIALIFLSGAALVWLYTPGDIRFSARLSASLLAGCGFLLCFSWVLLDANYNSMILLFFTWMLCGLHHFLKPVQHLEMMPKSVFVMGALGVGSGLMLMALIKIPAAGIACVLLLLLYTLANTQNINQQGIRKFFSALGLAFGLALAGALLVLLVLWLRGFSPFDLLNRFLTGYESVVILSAHSTSPAAVLQKISDHLTFLHTSYSLYPLPLFLGLGTILVAILSAHIGHTRIWVPICWSIGLAAIYLFWESSKTVSFLGYLQLSSLLRLLSLMTLVGLLTQYSAAFSRSTYLRICAIISGFFILSFGTTNSWAAQFSLYSGLLIASLCLCFIQLNTDGKIRFAAPVSLCLVGFTLLAAQQMERNPYRLGDRLSHASTQVLYGPNKTPMWTTPALARAYTPLISVRDTLGQKGAPAPYLIDMTGRAPGVNAFTGMRSPKVAWLLAGYPGSDAFLEFALRRIPKAELAKAWILIRKQSEETASGQSLDVDILHSYLREAQAANLLSYTAVTDIFIPDENAIATLYAPPGAWP